MMKKIVIGSLVFLCCFNSYSQIKDNYNEMLDSLLISISRLIINDIHKDSILLLKRHLVGIGESYVFEIVFDRKATYILRMLGYSDSMYKKFAKQEKFFDFQRHKMYDFRNFIREYRALPHDSFDYFHYRFLIPYKKGESFGNALYGEYKFKAFEKNIFIIDKKIEILQDENAMLQKYLSNF